MLVFVMFAPVKNPSPAEIKDLLATSQHKAARRIRDPRTGDHWYWPFEQATHAEGAKVLGILYERTPGEGDVIFL